GDRAFLMSFGVKRQVSLVTDLTGSAEELGHGVDEVDQCHPSLNPRACSSPVWEAVFTAAHSKMRNLTGRKALVLLSDGLDTGGPHGLADAIEAAQSGDTAVYTMMFQPTVARFSPLGLLAIRSAEARMRRLAEETGGRYHDASKKDAVPGI